MLKLLVILLLISTTNLYAKSKDYSNSNSTGNSHGNSYSNSSGKKISQLQLAWDKQSLSNFSQTNQRILEQFKERVFNKLPSVMIKSIHKKITIKISDIKNSSKFELPKCTSNDDNNNNVKDKKTTSPKKSTFTYGFFNHFNNSIEINKELIKQIFLKNSHTKTYNCKHKTTYQLAQATLIHEISHVYDLDFKRSLKLKKAYWKCGNKKSARLKNSDECLSIIHNYNRKTLISTEWNYQNIIHWATNTKKSASPDPYEYFNLKENFAVNFEYFILDPQFKCRKPSINNYLTNIFGKQVFKNNGETVNCSLNSIVLIGTKEGKTGLSKLDIKRLYQVDYLMAGQGDETFSSFGHTMIRLVFCAPEHKDPFTNQIVPATKYGKKCLKDLDYHIVVSYAAHITDLNINPFKGLIGTYKSKINFLTFQMIYQQYIRTELRNLVAYPLKLSANQKQLILQKIIEDYWSYESSYKFITNNCAVETRNLIQSVFPKTYIGGSVTPNGVLEDLISLGLTTKDIITGKNKESYFFKSNRYENENALKFIKLHLSQTGNLDQSKFSLSDFQATTTEQRRLMFQTSDKKNKKLAANYYILENTILNQFKEQYIKDISAENRKNIEAQRKQFDSQSNHIINYQYGIPNSKEFYSFVKQLNDLSMLKMKSYQQFINDINDQLKEIKQNLDYFSDIAIN